MLATLGASIELKSIDFQNKQRANQQATLVFRRSDRRYVMEGGGGGVKVEKAMALRRYRRVRQITTVIRWAEVIAALALISWSSSFIPDAIRLSFDFLSRLASLLISTPFVFLLGNAIVLTLFFAKSKQQQPCSPPTTTHAESHRRQQQSFIYEEFLKAASDIHQKVEEEKKRDDQMTPYCPSLGALRRTRSEHLKYYYMKPKVLQRSSTYMKEEERRVDEVEEEDDEKLRLRFEAFIAKEIKFRRDEETSSSSWVTITSSPN